MTSEADTLSVEFTTPEERAQLERLWLEGRLQHHHERILGFVREEREAILQLAAGRRDSESLVAATKWHIGQLRCVHRQSEMHDQCREIYNEIWYCGERGDHDHPRIKFEWVARHGSNWRHWRIKEYLFVVGCCGAEITALINVT